MKELLLKRLKKSKNKKGFTLIEIIVVLVILGILAAIAVPAVMGYIDDAKESKYVAEAHSIYMVVQAEEARCEAIGEKVDYGKVADEAESKTGFAKDSITITTEDANSTTGISESGTYTVKWTSDDNKPITASVKKNKDITITDK